MPTFPTQALPDWLRSFVEAEAEATQTPVDLSGMLSLSTGSTACGGKVVVHIRDGWIEPLNIYTVTALPPGNRKTVVFSDTVAPLEEYEEVEAQRMGPEIAEAETRRTIAEQALAKAQTEAVKAKPERATELEESAVALARELEEMVVPTRPRLIVDDCSPERLATLLQDQGGRIAVMSPEGDVFDLMAGRYSKNGAPNFGVFLKGHAGDTLRVDRVGHPPEYVKNPAITMGLAVQPEVITGLMKKTGFRGRGLLGQPEVITGLMKKTTGPLLRDRI